MTHDEFEAVAALDALGVASSQEESALRDHIQSCESCHKVRDEFMEAASLLALDLVPKPAPAEARQRIMDNVEGGEASLGGTTHRRFTVRPWWLATAAVLFLALWGWRELGIRVTKEHLASRDAEIRQFKEENTRLTEQAARLIRQMTLVVSAGARTFAVAAPPNVSARIATDAQGNGVLIVDKAAPNGVYLLWVNPVDKSKAKKVAEVDVPASGQKTMLINRLPAQKSIKSFSLTPR